MLGSPSDAPWPGFSGPSFSSHPGRSFIFTTLSDYVVFLYPKISYFDASHYSSGLKLATRGVMTTPDWGTMLEFGSDIKNKNLERKVQHRCAYLLLLRDHVDVCER
jgi:hypothetical protein